MFRNLLSALILSIVFCACQNNNHDQESVKDVEEITAAQQRPSPPVQNTITVNATTLTVDFSSPGVKGREIWGVLEPYDQVWRTGANEATWISSDQDIIIAGQELKAGKYALFTIPRKKDNWTVILNKKWDQWGAYEYKSSQDVLRFDVTVDTLTTSQERLSLDFVKGSDSNSTMLNFAWANRGFSIPISVN